VEGLAQTVGRQEVLAAALEAEELAVKGAEVGISEHRAGSGRLHAPLAALSRRLLQLLVGPALDRRTAHLGTADGAPVAAATAAGAHVPGLVVLVDHPVQAALAPHLGDGATRTTAIRLLELRRALQDRASGPLADGGAVQAGAVRTPVRHELRLLGVHTLVEEALAWEKNWKT